MKIEWIEIEGMMVAIDKSTGEILNDSLDTLPADYDVSQTVMDTLQDMFGSSLNTTSLLDKPKTGPKPKQVSNPYASFFSNVHYREDTGSSNMVDALDDLVYSASTASTGNTRIPIKQLVLVMKSDKLSTKEIQEALSKRRIIKGDKAPGKRYCQQILESAESLIKRIDTHQERGTINLNDSSAFQFEQDSMGYERSVCLSKAILCPVEFTEGDRRIIRALAKAGELGAINDYLQRITEHSGRMMSRITCNNSPVSSDSKEAFDELSAEFPYEPYETDSQTAKAQPHQPIYKKAGQSKPSKEWMYQIEKYEEEKNPAMDGAFNSFIPA
ncbi:hypothetical protein QM543_08060 [Pantoea eucrina]|uniref:hypothetical protein n=1 Tax=Pantoea eucrina TaxID=472693 RepID=UPI0024B7A56E|nr:hypothetical protein [Pantoea eucrina]MDJ0023237.1 hypothetical protein [Pantoea eucrina]